jgi:hypothetical protein
VGGTPGQRVLAESRFKLDELPAASLTARTSGALPQLQALRKGVSH